MKIIMNPVIAICGSATFANEIRSVAAELSKIGIDAKTPDFSSIDERRDISTVEKQQLALKFLEQIRSSDQLYIVANGGHTGTSVCIEAGFAFALGKPITISERPTEPAIAALCDAVVVPTDFVARFSNVAERERA
jgi:nucleoside 2-deoxyribosyltransferase